MPNPTSYSWVAVNDPFPPTIFVQTLDATTLRVIYSKGVVQSEATDIANYAFTGGLQALAIVSESPAYYLVTTSPQSPATSYTLTVSGVHDLDGNLI